MDNEEPQSSDGGATKEESKPAGMREWIMRFGAVGNVVLQGAAVLIKGRGPWPVSTSAQVGRGMLYGSAGLGAAHSPVVVYKERQLTKEDTFRTALNGIRTQQGRLTEQNDILTAEIDDLQSEVDRMKDVEMALRELSETQGTQLNELMDLINENKEINAALRMVLKNKVLEEVISLVLDIDNDGSFTIQNKEIDRLIIGMTLIEEVSFDKEIFRQEVIDCDGNVDEVISMIKHMIHGGGCGRETRCSIDVSCDASQYFEKARGTMCH